MDSDSSSSSIRRSSRIANSNHNSAALRITRKNSASNVSETSEISPPRDRRRSRRLSTDSDASASKPTPIRTRRGSKTVEEEDKTLIATPGTPSRGPVRRTRRSSLTQENDANESSPFPLRRSTRRRPSTDTENDEEIPIVKPVNTRRRRSSSMEETEEKLAKETKSKTRKLFSEDNQLEPIEEVKESYQNNKIELVKNEKIPSSLFSPIVPEQKKTDLPKSLPTEGSSPSKRKRDEESDDSAASFTLSLDKTETKIETSPGSNKENSSINNLGQLKKHVVTPKNSNLEEDSEHLDDVFEKTPKESPVITSKFSTKKTPTKLVISPKKTEDTQKDEKNSSEDARSNLLPFVPICRLEKIELPPRNEKFQDDSSGNSSIITIDDDVVEAPLPTSNLKGSKRRRISDGSSNRIIKQLMDDKKINRTNEEILENDLKSSGDENTKENSTSLIETSETTKSSSFLEKNDSNREKTKDVDQEEQGNNESLIIFSPKENVKSEIISAKESSVLKMNTSSSISGEGEQENEKEKSKIEVSFEDKGREERRIKRLSSSIWKNSTENTISSDDENEKEDSKVLFEKLSPKKFSSRYSKSPSKSLEDGANNSTHDKIEATERSEVSKNESSFKMSEGKKSPRSQFSSRLSKSPLNNSETFGNESKLKISVDEKILAGNSLSKNESVSKSLVEITSNSSDDEVKETNISENETELSENDKTVEIISQKRISKSPSLNVHIHKIETIATSSQKKDTSMKEFLRKSKSPSQNIQIHKPEAIEDSFQKENRSLKEYFRKSKSPSQNVQIHKPETTEDSSEQEETPKKRFSLNSKILSNKDSSREESPKNRSFNSKSPSKEISIHKTETNENIAEIEENPKKRVSLKSKSPSKNVQIHSTESIKDSPGREESFRQRSSLSSKSPTPKHEEKESPIETKLKKMKKCGVKITDFKIDEGANKKFDDFLKKNLKNIDSEEDKSESDDYDFNEFLDDMAEEGEEDTLSEDSNAIEEKGESLHSSDTAEEDFDDEYDMNDSFLVEDDGEELQLLSGEETYLKEDVKKTKLKMVKDRKRILQVSNSSEEEDEEEERKRIKKKEIPVEEEKNEEKETKEKISIYQKTEDDVFQIDLIEDSSNDEEKIDGNNTLNTSKSNEKIRSLIDMKSSTPNMSISENLNRSNQNKSSIIIHENIQITQINSEELSEKIKQVVEVFSSGIKSNTGNVSFNLSLDYYENEKEIDDSPSKKRKLNEDSEVKKIENKEEVIENTKDEEMNEIIQETIQPQKKSRKNKKRKNKSKSIETKEETFELVRENKNEIQQSENLVCDRNEVENIQKKKKTEISQLQIEEIPKKSKSKQSKKQLEKKNDKFKKSLIEAATNILLSNKNDEQFGFKCEKIPKIKSAELKRLQSKPKHVHISEKNKNKKINLKPSSTSIDNNSSWMVDEEENLKPSTSNAIKCTFDYAKINENDFKNQMLYDPRIKREKSTNLIKRKGYFI